MNSFIKTTFAVCLLASIGSAAMATKPNAEEFEKARQWIRLYFEEDNAVQKRSGLVVLDNYEDVIINGRSGGMDITIDGKKHTRGLGCHANSRIVVKLQKKAKRFEAIAALDDGGLSGSIVFTVEGGNKVLFKSDVLRAENRAVNINVDLKGLDQFVLDASNAGDGIGHDWADWADAKVVFEDGSEVWLNDLPFIDMWSDSNYCFSFIYDDQNSHNFLNDWHVKRFKKNLDNDKVQHFLKYIDPKTDLVVELQAIEYKKYPTVEWEMTLTNNGKEESSLIRDIRPLDFSVETGTGNADYILHHMAGSYCGAGDYEPMETVLKKNESLDIIATNGRPTEMNAPYFNIDFKNSGIIFALGWQGQWGSYFTRTSGNTLSVNAGQEVVKTVLYPGETISTPRVVMQFWDGGDWIRAQNIWRRWMMAYNTPKPGGISPNPHMAACSSHVYSEMENANEENQKMFIDRYIEEQLPLDYWWMDAGWYINYGKWFNTGTWIVDKERFPNGLRAITDYGRSKGIKTILWFEPECVTPGTELALEHRDWILADKNWDSIGHNNPSGWALLNIGIPEAREWLTTRLKDIIKAEGVDLYRQDFRLGPIFAWRNNDEENRVGISEIRHCEAYLKNWDELIKEFPSMLIDSCAAGGRRNEIDAMKRAVPLLRSDFIIDPLGNQCHTYGISFWMPYHGCGVKATDPYGFRSTLTPMQNACFDMRDRNLDYDSMRKRFEEWKLVAPYMLGDYYPLTDYSLKTNAWIGWQFDVPENGEGMIEMFRRPDSNFITGDFKLRGLENDAKYVFTDIDTQERWVKTGEDLMKNGLEITIPTSGKCILYTYKKSE